MVVKVQLEGLNVRKARGKWYVSHRLTGTSLLRGFSGSRDALDKRLGRADVLSVYNGIQHRQHRLTYAPGTLGDLVRWYKDECPNWDKLSAASKSDYEKSFLFLETGFACRLIDLTTEDIATTRNRAAKARWPRFADKMVSHLSTIFSLAAEVGRMTGNPAAGVKKLHKSDPNANHEWRADEVAAAIKSAPAHLLTAILLSRYQGFRGQTCAALRWDNYIPDARFGRAFSVVVRKNKQPGWFPADPIMREHLDGLEKTATTICTNRDGLPWPSEKTLQGAVSDYFDKLKAEGKLRTGCTLHGLRVTYAASIRRQGHDTGTVADALGDRSEAMGRHYTRHVEKEASLIRIHSKTVVQK